MDTHDRKSSNSKTGIKGKSGSQSKTKRFGTGSGTYDKRSSGSKSRKRSGSSSKPDKSSNTTNTKELTLIRRSNISSQGVDSSHHSKKGRSVVKKNSKEALLRSQLSFHGSQPLQPADLKKIEKKIDAEIEKQKKLEKEINLSVSSHTAKMPADTFDETQFEEVDLNDADKGKGEGNSKGKVNVKDNVITMEKNSKVMQVSSSANPSVKTALTSATQSTAIPGENLQNAVDHGEYLLDFPILSISLDFVELAITIIATILAIIGTQGNIEASYVLLLSATIILALLIAIIAIQWKAYHVKEEKDLNDTLKYSIGPKARLYFAAIHLLRLMLVFAMALILIYYAACWDEALGIRKTSVCREITASKGLFATSASLFLIQAILITTHLVFYCKNRLSVRSCK